MRRLLLIAVALLSCAPLGMAQAPSTRAAILSGGNPILFSYAAGDDITAKGGTFSRTSTATYVDASGVIQSIATGTLRDAHYISGNRTTLLEGARTNLALQSEALNTGWTLVAATITADATTAPDGNATADKIAETAATNEHKAYRQFVGTLAPYTISCYLKAAERTWAFIDHADNTAGDVRTWFDLGTGAVGTVGAGCTATITAVANGYYRCTVTRTYANTGAYIQIGAATGDGVFSYLGVAGNGIYAWGAQVELGSFASSYIPTTTATVTRAADSLTFTQTAAASQATHYERYYDLATAAFVDSVATITAGSNYPTNPTIQRAYRYSVTAKGDRLAGFFQGKYTP